MPKPHPLTYKQSICELHSALHNDCLYWEMVPWTANFSSLLAHKSSEYSSKLPIFANAGVKKLTSEQSM